MPTNAWQVQKLLMAWIPVNSLVLVSFLVLLFQPQDYYGMDGITGQGGAHSNRGAAITSQPLTTVSLSKHTDRYTKSELTRPSRASQAALLNSFPTIFDELLQMFTVQEVRSLWEGLWGACRALYTLGSRWMWCGCSPLPELWIAACFLSQVNQVSSGKSSWDASQTHLLPYQGVGQVVSKGSILPAIMWEVSGPLNAEFLVTSVRECSRNPRPYCLPHSLFLGTHMRWPAKQPPGPQI